MITTQMKQEVLAKIEELRAMAQSRYGKLITSPRVFFDVRGTRGGYHQGGELHFNPVLLAENYLHYLKQVVPHEMAHYVQMVVFPSSLIRMSKYSPFTGKVEYSRRRIHGFEWQAIMRLFGVPADRCHNYDTENSVARKVKKYPVYCRCEEPNYVTNRIIRNVLDGRIYTCRRCRSQIVLRKQLTETLQPA